MIAQTNRVLVIDDDPNICQLIRIYFEKEGFEVQHALNGLIGLEIFSKHQFGLVLLDIMMPDMGGLDVCREIRKSSDTPVIMLTAKGETLDKVLGLELGADDYIVKPFDPKELIARARAVLRRYNKLAAKTEQNVVYENLTINIADYTVTFRGETYDIPPKELELFYFLASHPNRVFTRDQLLEQIWGYDYYGDSRTIDVHIKRLREKFAGGSGTWQIKTVWGVGYKFEVK